MTATAPKLTPAEWAKAIFAHWKAQQPDDASVSEETFAAAADLSRGGYRKIIEGKNKPRFDTMEKLRRVAPAHLKKLEPSNETEMSDPQGSLAVQSGSKHNGDGGYNVTSEAGKILARMFDAMDEKMQPEALRKCLNALAAPGESQNPSKRGVK